MKFERNEDITQPGSTGLIIGLMFIIGSIPGFTIQAADNIHLLGFVDRLCHQETYCFELKVEQAYSGVVDAQVKVYYDDTSQIFDPENYALTLAQSQIVEGSHLRLLLEKKSGRYLARFIWIGD